MSRDAQIVIGPSGIVLAASGDLPSGGIDTPLADWLAMPAEVRHAGTELIGQLRGEPGRVATRTVAIEDGRSVQLIAVEAVLIRRTATDIRSLLSGKLAVIGSQAAAADVPLTVAVAADVPEFVPIDAEKIAWAVTTLVGNALRYVRAGSRRMTRGKIHVGAAYDLSRPQLTIEVADDGRGIPADTVARLFKRDGLEVRGAGLSLLVIADICAAHGGSIEVDSRTDQQHGTRIRLKLTT